MKTIERLTMAGLIGLVILNPKPFASIASGITDAFRNAVKLGTGKG